MLSLLGCTASSIHISADPDSRTRTGGLAAPVHCLPMGDSRHNDWISPIEINPRETDNPTRPGSRHTGSLRLPQGMLLVQFSLYIYIKMAFAPIINSPRFGGMSSSSKYDTSCSSSSFCNVGSALGHVGPMLRARCYSNTRDTDRCDKEVVSLENHCWGALTTRNRARIVVHSWSTVWELHWNARLTLSSLNLSWSSSSTTSRELLSQFSTCSGWRWFDVV